MSIVISGCIGLFNRGVEALVAPTISELRRVLPSQEITLLTGQPNYDSRRACLEGVKLVRDPFLGRVNSLRARRVAARWCPRLVRADAAGHRAIRDASLLIATGGDTFSSDYGDLRMHLEPLYVARLYGTPFALLAHSIGPFTSDAQRDQFLDIARHAALITVRESRSYEYCVSELQLDASRVVQTADPAFLLEPAGVQRVRQLQLRYGINSDEPVIALAVSQGISNFSGLTTSGESTAERHLATLQQLARHITQEMGLQLLLIPHVQDIRPANNDLLLCDKLMDSLESTDRVAVAWGDHSAAEFKGLISASDAVIAERMHAAIAALSTGTPVMVVKYSVKATGIIGDLLGHDAEQSGAIVPFEDYLAWQQHRGEQTVDQLWGARQKIRDDLAGKIDAMKQQARENYELFGRLVHAG